MDSRRDVAGIDRVLAEADAGAVRLTRVLWCGNDGTVRAKAAATPTLRSRMVGGIGLTRAQQAQNALDGLAEVPGMGPVGEMRLIPDPTTFRLLPYAPRTAGVLADMVDLSGSPEPACPRGFLRRMESRLADHGLSCVAGFESEFVLAREGPAGWEPIDRSPCFSTAGATASQDFMDALLAMLDAQGIGVESCYAEGGAGQNEIALAPGPALRAADEQVLVRETLRGLAPALGLAASVAPKPWQRSAGNGLHVHLSLRDRKDRNVLGDPAADHGLSRISGSLVAGLLAHLPGLCAITAPSAGSYRRLVPRAWAGAWRCWGHDNREAAVRACSPFAGREEQTSTVEYKPSDASASPYMTLGALIAAGLDGIERGMTPPDPVGVDPATLSDAERAERGIAALPRTPAEALDALEADGVLLSALGNDLARSFIAVRRSEWAIYQRANDAREFADHFLRY